MSIVTNTSLMRESDKDLKVGEFILYYQNGFIALGELTASTFLIAGLSAGSPKPHFIDINGIYMPFKKSSNWKTVAVIPIRIQKNSTLIALNRYKVVDCNDVIYDLTGLYDTGFSVELSYGDNKFISLNTFLYNNYFRLETKVNTTETQQGNTNEGRSTCYLCNKPTKVVNIGFTHNNVITICSDMGCESNK